MKCGTKTVILAGLKATAEVVADDVVPQNQFYQAPIKSGKYIGAWGAVCGSLVENIQSLLDPLHCVLRCADCQ